MEKIATSKDLTKQQSIDLHDELDVNSFNLKRFNRGIIDEISPEDIRELLINPQSNQKDLENLSFYYYLSNGNIFQQFDLTRVLPQLNYAIETLKVSSKADKNTITINKLMRCIDHKTLTRDIISQLITAGTVCGIWLGSGNDLYPFIFDNLEYFFPAKRRQGKWVVWCDLGYFDTLDESTREEMLECLTPYISKEDYDNYLENRLGYRYVEIPVERGFVLRTHTLFRNQNFGFPWVTTSLYDIAHKKTLKDLEKAVSNKIVNAIAVMTIGNKDKPNSTINKEVKKKVYSKAKEGLEANEQNSISMLSLPEWATLEFGKFDSEPLNPKKFESINSDLTNASGVSKALTNGEGSYSSGKLNLDVLYTKISELLEIIEIEVYNRAINLLLSKSDKDMYFIEYFKGTPLSTKEMLDIYMKLFTSGHSITPILDILGRDAKQFVEQSKREIEEWNIRDIYPPATSYTMSESDTNGRPEEAQPTNEATVASNDNSANMNPRANV